MKNLLDRKQLPPFMKLSYQFDIDKILSEFDKFSDVNNYNDLNSQSPDSEYLGLCESRKDFHSNFVTEEEKVSQEDIGYNSAHYRQLSLTSYDPDKKLDLKKFRNLKHKHHEIAYSKRKPICDGYWSDILDTFKSEVTRVRFAYLSSGFSLKPHIDYNTTYSIRIHIPIITNEECYMFVESNKKLYKEHWKADGSSYFINTGLTHWAENNGDTGRIHLVISINGQEDLWQK